MKAENHVLKLKQEMSLLQVIGQRGPKGQEPPQQRWLPWSGNASFPPTQSSWPCFSLLSGRVVGTYCIVWDGTNPGTNFPFLWTRAGGALKDGGGLGPSRVPSGDTHAGRQPPSYCLGQWLQLASHCLSDALLWQPPKCFTALAHLQAQVSNFRRENEALRSGQGASLTVVKQNTDVALQNLRVVMNNAHASIK